MPRYFDADKLLEQVKSLEQLARKRVQDTPTNSPAYERYAAQHQERVKMLAILNAQATADVIEVVRCRDCKESEAIPAQCLWCNFYEHPVLENGFCHCGERREQQ